MDAPQRRHRRRLTILVEETDEPHRGEIGLAAEVILDLAREAGLSSGAAFPAAAGFGFGRAGTGRPTAVVVLGDVEGVEDFARAMALALPSGLITLDDVEEVVPVAPPDPVGDAPARPPLRLVRADPAPGRSPS
ncbi:hypothetical protein SAMN05443637_111156 [Pseudonocardia thermophila]|uniref:Uncharacterized protein n=1 Tax=Pseudonocardia thermophila TaxID=1848 RepID=A0A1M6V2F5_PSETH|nr:hypothetical protein [Pseudonocardia thermophila]SHK75630.1 hypothetical protein SAMN05443637_111156 [Pseudonocardia thermophila]